MDGATAAMVAVQGDSGSVWQRSPLASRGAFNLWGLATVEPGGQCGPLHFVLAAAAICYGHGGLLPAHAVYGRAIRAFEPGCIPRAGRIGDRLVSERHCSVCRRRARSCPVARARASPLACPRGHPMAGGSGACPLGLTQRGKDCSAAAPSPPPGSALFFFTVDTSPP